MPRALCITVKPTSGSFLGFRVAAVADNDLLGSAAGSGGEVKCQIPNDPIVLRLDCAGLGAGTYTAVFDLPDEKHTYTVDRTMRNGEDAFSITV